MKSGPFAHVVARLLRLDPQSVTVAARHLKSAGLMATGARGVNAPEMTGADLAALLLSLLATDRPAWAADMLNRYKGFQLSAPSMAQAVGSRLPDPDHTLLDFLNLICDPSFPLDPDHEFTVRAVATSHVEVEGGEWTLIYWPRDEVDRLAAEFAAADLDNLPEELASELYDGPMSRHGLVTSREVKSSDIDLIKRVVFGDAAEVQPSQTQSEVTP